jgi:hypothetical protein
MWLGGLSVWWQIVDESMTLLAVLFDFQLAENCIVTQHKRWSDGNLLLIHYRIKKILTNRGNLWLTTVCLHFPKFPTIKKCTRLWIVYIVSSTYQTPLGKKVFWTIMLGEIYFSWHPMRWASMSREPQAQFFSLLFWVQGFCCPQNGPYNFPNAFLNDVPNFSLICSFLLHPISFVKCFLCRSHSSHVSLTRVPWF